MLSAPEECGQSSIMNIMGAIHSSAPEVVKQDGNVRTMLTAYLASGFETTPSFPTPLRPWEKQQFCKVQ